MTSTSDTSGSGALDALLADVVDEFEVRVQAGDEPDPEEYASRYPEHSDRIRAVLGTLRRLGSADPLATEAIGLTVSRLGDYVRRWLRWIRTGVPKDAQHQIRCFLGYTPSGGGRSNFRLLPLPLAPAVECESNET